MHLTQDYVGEAFQSERRGIIKLSDEAWNALSPDGKKLWRNLNHDDRLQILESGKPPDTNTNAGSPTPTSSKMRTKHSWLANLWLSADADPVQ